MYSCLNHFGLYINICMTCVESISLKQLWYKKPRLWYLWHHSVQKHMLWAFSSIYLYICICVYLSLVFWITTLTTQCAIKVSIMTIRFAQCFNLAKHRIDIDLRNAFLGCHSYDWYFLISKFSCRYVVVPHLCISKFSAPCWLHIKASTFQAPGVVDRANPPTR